MILPVVAESYVVRRDSERLWLICAVRCAVVWCGVVRCLLNYSGG